MLKIDRQPAFWTDVNVTLPGEEEQSFRARFKVMSVDAFRAIDLNDGDKVGKFLADSVIGLEGVEDAKGEVAWSPAVVHQLAQMPHIRGALFRAYDAGVSKAARGN